MKNKLAEIGFVIDGKPITKKKFKELAVDMKYGSSYIIYLGQPKQGMFKIFPAYGTPKKESLDFAYKVLMDMFEGYQRGIEQGQCEWSTRGYHISYGSPSPYSNCL